MLTTLVRKLLFKLKIGYFSDPRYGGNPAYNDWSDRMREEALASVPELLNSNDPADVIRLEWIKKNNAEFDLTGGECCPLRCQPGNQSDDDWPIIEGWGDDAREAVDSAIDDERRFNVGARQLSINP